MAVLTTTPGGNPDEARFNMRAYVCAAGDVRMTGDVEGITVTFTQIYQRRPKNCRYAIAGWWSIVKNDYRFVAFDLFGVKLELSTNAVITPKPRLEHDDFDAIVMATVMLYDEGS